MSLRDGKVTTVDKVGSFRLPEESSTWLAYYKGTGGAGGAAGCRRTRRARRRCATRGAGAAAQGRGGGAERARSQAAGLRSDPPQPRDRRRSHDPRSHRVRLEQEGHAARLRGVVERRDEGRRVRATAARRHRHDAALRARDATAASRSTRPAQQIAFLSDQAEFEKPVAPYRLYYWKAGEAEGAPSSCRQRRRACRRAWSSPKTARRASRATARGSSSATAPPPAPAPRPERDDARADRRGPLVHEGSLDPADAARPRRRRAQRATTARSCTSPTRSSSSSRRRNCRRQRRRRSRSRDRHVRPRLPAGSVVGQDLQRRTTSSISRPASRKQILEALGRRRDTLSPGGQVRPALRRDRPATGSPTASPTARASNLTERIRTCASSRKSTTRRTRPARTASAAGPTAIASVLLYDEFDIWEVKPDGSGAAQHHRRRRPEGAASRSAIARSIPEERTVPANKPLLLSATDDRTRATGFYRLPSLTATAAPREGRDARQGVRRGEQGEERRHRRLHAVTLRGVPGPLGQRH